MGLKKIFCYVDKLKVFLKQEKTEHVNVFIDRKKILRKKSPGAL